MKSLKPFVLLFDEFYTKIYKMHKAELWMQKAKKFIFMGTSFSVNITNIALNNAINNNAIIHIVDPLPTKISYENVKYFEMTAEEYIKIN